MKVFDNEVDVEAVSFSESGLWHAVPVKTDRTRCGLSAMDALRMWHRWEDEKVDRCKKCQGGDSP